MYMYFVKSGTRKLVNSLLVCLPSQFSGGALVTRHQGKEVRFDWSSSAQEPMQKVSWAAFSSDVELEVLPVTDGWVIPRQINRQNAFAFQISTKLCKLVPSMKLSHLT